MYAAGYKIFTNASKVLNCQPTKHLHLSSWHRNQAKSMKKVMGGNSKKKSKYYEAPALPSPTTFSKGSFEGKQSADSKRARVLNKLFMQHITDLMATGECSSKFIGYGIEINKVQVTPDFNCIRVYWIARGTETDQIVEKILNNHAGDLRHELAQLKAVGITPTIKFLRDKQYARAVQVDQLLAKADYGEDYVPVDFTAKFKTQLELNMKLAPNVVSDIKELDEDEIEYEEPLPEMPQNVFGLNHSEIMQRVVRLKKKSEAPHRLQENVQTAEVLNENPVQFASAQKERQAFKEFLMKREVLKHKANKIEKNYRPESDLLQDELRLHWEKIPSDGLDNAKEEADFLEEDSKRDI